MDVKGFVFIFQLLQPIDHALTLSQQVTLEVASSPSSCSWDSWWCSISFPSSWLLDLSSSPASSSDLSGRTLLTALVMYLAHNVPVCFNLKITADTGTLCFHGTSFLWNLNRKPPHSLMQQFPGNSLFTGVSVGTAAPAVVFPSEIKWKWSPVHEQNIYSHKDI